MHKKYTKEVHFKYKLNQLEGNVRVPDDVLKKVKDKLEVLQINRPSKNTLKIILRELDLQYYYDLIPSMFKILNPPTVSITVDNEEECPICFETVDTFANLLCKHKFCETCVQKITEQSKLRCPLCRRIQNYMKDKELTPEQRDILVDDFKSLPSTSYNRSFSEIIKLLAEARGYSLMGDG